MTDYPNLLSSVVVPAVLRALEDEARWLASIPVHSLRGLPRCREAQLVHAVAQGLKSAGYPPIFEMPFRGLRADLCTALAENELLVFEIKRLYTVDTHKQPTAHSHSQAEEEVARNINKLRLAAFVEKGLRLHQSFMLVVAFGQDEAEMADALNHTQALANRYGQPPSYVIARDAFQTFYPPVPRAEIWVMGFRAP